MNVAFLGLGIMGHPMAANLLDAGHSLRIWNRSRSATAALAAHGARAFDTPIEAVDEADIVISMLADDNATRTVMSETVLAAMRSGTIHVNMATVSVQYATELADAHRAHGINYVAAPVLGRVDVARAGQLNILAGCDALTLSKVQPLFDALGQRTWHIGERPEQANAVKLGINFMIASAIGTMGEATALAKGHGVDAADFIELATSTVFAAPVYKGYGAAIAESRFEPAGFKLELGLKDVRLAQEAAEAVNVPLPLAGTLRDAHVESLAHDEGLLDWAALARTSARRAGQT
ncbi:NAD(P)-dependent oxidoreductase [Vreelandella sp. EE22]